MELQSKFHLIERNQVRRGTARRQMLSEARAIVDFSIEIHG